MNRIYAIKQCEALWRWLSINEKTEDLNLTQWARKKNWPDWFRISRKVFNDCFACQEAIDSTKENIPYACSNCFLKNLWGTKGLDTKATASCEESLSSPFRAWKKAVNVETANASAKKIADYCAKLLAKEKSKKVAIALHFVESGTDKPFCGAKAGRKIKSIAHVTCKNCKRRIRSLVND